MNSKIEWNSKLNEIPHYFVNQFLIISLAKISFKASQSWGNDQWFLRIKNDNILFIFNI